MAASIAVQLIKRGFHVGLVSGGAYLPPAGGPMQAAQLLQALALVQAGTARPLPAAASRVSRVQVRPAAGRAVGRDHQHDGGRAGPPERMRFRAVHKLMSYLLAAAAVGTLMTTGSVPLPTLALLGGLGVLSWFVEPGTPFGRLLDRAGLVFNVVALAFFGLSLFQVIESFPEPELTPILNVVLFLLGYKLFHRRNNRDYLQIYVLSFLLILASAWLAQTIFFVVGFVAYVVLATWTLILFHLRREIEDNYLVKHLPESGSEKVTAARVLNSRRVVGRSFFVATGAMSLAVFLGAAVVFAVIPRVGIGFLSGTFRRRVNIVGFSDEVTLGHHGVISGDNQTVVLWVRLPRLEQVRGRRSAGPDHLPAVLAGNGLRHLHATASGSARAGPRPPPFWTKCPRPMAAKLYWLRSPEAPPRERRYSEQQLAALDEQEIHVVGLSHPVAFALDEPVVFRAPVPPPGSFVSVGMQQRFGGEVGLRLERSMGLPGSSVKEFSGARYLAYSRQLYGRMPFGFGRPTAELRNQGLLTSYLTVPKSMSPRVGELARTITEGKIGPMAKALAIVEWLQKTHQYTTDLRRNPSVADPLEDFLFHQNAGHCEYFASATAVLLRLAGCPAGTSTGSWAASGTTSASTSPSGTTGRIPGPRPTWVRPAGCASTPPRWPTPGRTWGGCASWWTPSSSSGRAG